MQQRIGIDVGGTNTDAVLMCDQAVREWVKRAEVDARERVGMSTEEQKELAERLREDVEILKRATAFFAKETR